MKVTTASLSNSRKSFQNEKAMACCRNPSCGERKITLLVSVRILSYHIYAQHGYHFHFQHNYCQMQPTYRPNADFKFALSDLGYIGNAKAEKSLDVFIFKYTRPDRDGILQINHRITT